MCAMKRTGALWAALAAALMAGCVPSLHPICGDDDALFDAGLLGVWKADGAGKETLTFLDAGNRHYRVAYVEGNGEHGLFDVRLTRIGGALFLDAYPERADVAGNGYYRLHLVSAHTFMKVAATNGTMALAPVAAKWLGELLADDPQALRHEALDKDTILMTASTAELRKFLAEYQATAEAFEQPTRWRREAGGRAP